MSSETLFWFFLALIFTPLGVYLIFTFIRDACCAGVKKYHREVEDEQKN